MAVSTKIQWCDSTCNPTMGCEGCELWTSKVKKCYAGMLHRRFGGATRGYSPTFEEITYWPGRMEEAARWRDLRGMKRPDKPWLDGLPRLIFVSDMSDALSSEVPFEFLENEIIANVTSDLGQRHCWLWLTKRPDRMAKFSAYLTEKGTAWPQNLWAGTSITSQTTTSRIRHLLKVGNDSTIRFLSVEPQYVSIDLTPWLPNLDWIIQGGESGPSANDFDVAWAYSLIRDCRAHDVPYFLKQLGAVVRSNGSELTFDDGHAGDWAEWPKQLRVRQLPKLTSKRQSSGSSRPAVKQGINGAQKRRQAALKAWETRRANALASAVEED